MSKLEIEEQVITEKELPVDMEQYIKFKLGLQPLVQSTPDPEKQSGRLSVEQVIKATLT